MEFTSREKSALIGVLSAVMYADGLIEGKEMDYLGRIQYEMEMSDEIIRQGLEMDPAEAFDIIKAMDESKKEIASRLLIKMAYSDRKLDATEYEIITGILLRCGITPEGI